MRHRREGHYARVEPGISDIPDSAYRLPTAGAADLDRVHIRPVRAVALELAPALNGARGQLFPAGQDVDSAARAVVDRQGQAPIALLADHPVMHVQEPVQLPLVTESRDPLDVADYIHDLVSQAGVDLGRSKFCARRRVDLTHADVPLIDEAEDERRAATPAVGIAVSDRFESIEAVLVLERLDDRVFDVADIAAAERTEPGDDDSTLIERGDRRQAQRLAQREVLSAATGGNVDDAGALFLADLVPQDNSMLVGRPVRAGNRRKGRLYGGKFVEWTRIPPAGKLPAQLLLDDLEGTLQGRLQRSATQPECLVTLLYLDVSQLLAHGRGHVRGQSPGRRGPHEERLAGPIEKRELDRQAWVFTVGVALGHLVLADACTATGAPGHGVVALV